MATGALVEEVATNLEEVAEVTRTVNAAVVSAFLGGTGFGGVLGAIWGYRFGKQRTKAEAMKEAQEEIDHMREHFDRRHVARLNEEAKKEVGEIVELQGYVSERPSPFVVPSQPVVQEFERPLPAPVPVREPEPEQTRAFSWNYNDEFAARRPGVPYVLHEDEYHNDNLPTHTKVTYTYYGTDAVLADEDSSRIENVEELIGARTLNRFGHGSSDPNIVYVRNDRLQLQIEITRLPSASYEEEVEGLNNETKPA